MNLNDKKKININSIKEEFKSSLEMFVKICETWKIEPILMTQAKNFNDNFSNTDEFILEYKGSLPVCSYDERKLVLENSVYVTNVVPNIGGADSKPSIENVNPDIIAIGTDWARKNYYEQMKFTQDWLDEKNIMLLYVPYTKGISSTEIKKRL